MLPPLRRARGSEEALASSCRAPPYQDQTFGDFSFFFHFSDLRRPQVSEKPTCDSSWTELKITWKIPNDKQTGYAQQIRIRKNRKMVLSKNSNTYMVQDDEVDYLKTISDNVQKWWSQKIRICLQNKFMFSPSPSAQKLKIDTLNKSIWQCSKMMVSKNGNLITKKTGCSYQIKFQNSWKSILSLKHSCPKNFNDDDLKKSNMLQVDDCKNIRTEKVEGWWYQKRKKT